MMKYDIGDLVMVDQPATMKSGKIVIPKGVKFIVNDTQITYCKCTTNSTWYYIWLGHYFPGDDGCRYTCPQCDFTYMKDKKMWIQQGNITKLDPHKEFSTKFGTQIELMKLLIGKQITPEAYRKIMAMTEGDSELLELGNQILNKIGTNEL